MGETENTEPLSEEELAELEPEELPDREVMSIISPPGYDLPIDPID